MSTLNLFTFFRVPGTYSYTRWVIIFSTILLLRQHRQSLNEGKKEKSKHTELVKGMKVSLPDFEKGKR